MLRLMLIMSRGNIPGGILGEIPPKQFLAEYWQKKPLLIKNALADLPTLSADELAGLSMEDEIESRLVLEDQSTSNWQLRPGPFSEQTLQDLPDSHWSLLVQAVDQWLPEAHALLDDFSFLPRWRLDDIMVSLSADQGSVGPHFDNYDVFLLQTRGQKRWRIGQVCDADTPLIENAPLCLIEDFQQQEEYLLEPGDMLYLPPRLAHWGIAEGESMTFSIGFRAPTAVELLDDLATELLANPKLASKPFIDPAFYIVPASDQAFKQPFSEVDKKPNKNPTGITGGAITPPFIEAVKNLLIEQLSDDKLLSEWFARFMTERKYPELELLAEKDSPVWQGTLADDERLSWHPASRCA
ncbi:MAG: cupin domain-containing protein, partial [Porticoccaceae bacterium]|nr:cupin domain-containing protein [Porticoccaceae bacterium]